MDPQACLANIIKALELGEKEEAIIHIDALHSWMNRKGFAPQVTPSDLQFLLGVVRDSLPIGAPLMKYTVIEVQECTLFRRWRYAVEASSPEEAITKVRTGDPGLACDGHPIGDEDFGKSGFAVVQDFNIDAATEAARTNLTESL